MAQQNLYTFNPFQGLVAGIPLAVGLENPNRPSTVFPPHLRCGDAFIAVERSWEHPNMVKERLLSAALAWREPAGRKSFLVFDRHTEKEKRFFCFFDNKVPAGVKVRYNPNQVNAWQGARMRTPSDTFALLMGDGYTGNCFFAAAPGDTVYVYSANGAVYAFGCRDDGIHVMPLSLREMAQLRVEQFEEQISDLDLHIEQELRRFHGIVGGCVRLLQLEVARTQKERERLGSNYVDNAEVRGVFVDFLTEWSGRMTTRQRAEIRTLLLLANDPLAGNFVEGWSSPDVVRLDDHRPSGQGKTRAELERRKAERAERDRQLRAEMVGKSGGKPDITTNPKKAAKIKRKQDQRR